MMSQSPSSVRWHGQQVFETKKPSWHYLDEQADHDAQAAQLSEAWKVPGSVEMQRRLEFRRSIREETLQHRRIHRHGGNAGGRNIARVLLDREQRGAGAHRHLTYRVDKDKVPFTGNPSITNEIRTFAEYCSVVRYHSAFFQHLGGQDQVVNGQRPSSSQAVSTISVAFSPDARTMASTHGDHTVKITCTNSGHLLQTLEGHPRTPWTVKYHPLQAKIVASGCLGHQVRLWNWTTGACLHMIRLEFAIISLSFHPQGNVLAIANGTRLHFWSLQGLLPSSTITREDDKDAAAHQAESSTSTPPQAVQGTSDNAAGQPAGAQSRSASSSRGILTEVEQRHMLRCVHFPPDGKTIIVGGVNNNTPEPQHPHHLRGRRVGSSGMSFYLRLFDFDVELALNPMSTQQQQQQPPAVAGGYRKRVISNPRTFVPRALLYNDGGFDVSPDGKTLCACAEYWLPDGVDNAMDMLYPQQQEDEDDDDDSVMAHDDDDALLQPQDPTSSTAVPPSSEENPATSAASVALNTTTSATAVSSSEDPPLYNVATPNNGSPPRNNGGIPPPHPNSTIAPSSLAMALSSSSATTTDRLNNPLTPQTPPPSAIRPPFSLSPPSPPGRRFAGGLSRLDHNTTSASNQGSGAEQSNQDGTTTATNNRSSGSSSSDNNLAPPPPPPPPGMQQRTDHHHHVVNSFSMMTTPTINGGTNASNNGRFVPHVVTISLDTSPEEARDGSSPTSLAARTATPVSKFTRPRLGQLLEACPLDGAKASAVTCVKFSPSTNFCLIGYGVREPVVEHNGNHYHPVTALYRVRGGMTHVSTMLSGDDDVNIARFHPESGYGFVYGTKQGRVRVLSPRPWNFYNC